jgi:hypothetical protein
VARVRELIERDGGIRAEPRERGHVLRAHEHVDGIDLEPVDARRDAPNVGTRWCARRTRRAETLGGEREPTRVRSGELCGRARYARNVARP